MKARVAGWGMAAVAALTGSAFMLPPTGPAGAASGSTSTSSTGSSSSSPGITKTTITVGQIDDLSAPVPGLFKAAEDGTKAYFNYLNSTGGINGRKVILDTRDSGYNSATVVKDAQGIAQSDFAMVGGYSLVDGAEQPVVDQNKLPDVTYPLDSKLSNDVNVYSPSPSTTNDTPDGPYQWAKKTFPNEIGHVGIIYPAANSTTISSEFKLENTMTATGFKVLYRRGFATTESTFTSDVLKMKSDGVSMYFDSELPGLYASTLAKETQLQGFHPTNVQGIAAYVANMQQQSGGAANGMYLVQQASLYEGEDAHAIPEVGLFDKWAKQVDPNVFTSVTPLPALDGWASGMLFAQALKAAGPNPTRAALMAQLNKVTSFNANGLLPPGENPAQNIPSKCFLVARLENGAWSRVSPKSGFICSPSSLHPAKGWKPQTR